MTSLINQANIEPIGLPLVEEKNQYADQVLDDVDERSQDFATLEDQEEKPIQIFDTPFAEDEEQEEPQPQPKVEDASSQARRSPRQLQAIIAEQTLQNDQKEPFGDNP